MTPDELRAIMVFLQERVQPGDAGEAGEVTVRFDAPTPEVMAQAGLKMTRLRSMGFSAKFRTTPRS